jgi:hypothetical protein
MSADEKDERGSKRGLNDRKIESKNCPTKKGGIAAAQPLEGGEGDLLCWLLRLFSVLFHAFLPALLAVLHELLRLLPLLRSKHGIDLRPHAFFLDNQVSRKLGLLAGERAGVVFVKCAVDAGLFRLFILAELLHQRLDLGLLAGHDAFDLGLLGLSQVQLFGHVFQHPTVVAAKTHMAMLSKSGRRQAGCHGH